MIEPSKGPKAHVLQVGTLHVNATPFGLVVYAEEFLDAAKQFKSSRDFSPALCYLYCHSLELSLKCFLLGKGVKKRELMNRRKFGHDLVKLVTEAVRLGIDKLVTFTPEHLENIRKANAYYRSKEFEYFEIAKAVTAYPDLPDLKVLAQLASDHVEPLRRFAGNVA